MSIIFEHPGPPALIMRYLFIVPLLLLVAFSQDPSPSRGIASNQNQAISKAAQQPTANDQRGTEQSPVFVKEIPPPKTQEEAAQEARERNEKSANDRHLVVATVLLGIIGALQLFVFGYQAYKLKQTVEATTQQSEDTERAIAETARAANATEQVATNVNLSVKAANASVDAIGQQMRAYISVVVGTAIPQDKANKVKFQAVPSITNAGLTPARKVSFKAAAAILPVPLPDDFKFPLPPILPGTLVVSPRQSIAISPSVDDFVEDAEVDGIKNATGGRALYAWGTFNYEDIFGKPQYTEFCHMYTWLADGKTTWGYYNERHNDAS